MNDEYLKPSEVAKLLKITPRSVIKMILEGRIKALQISGTKRKSYRILSGELDRFSAEQYQKYQNGVENE